MAGDCGGQMHQYERAEALYMVYPPFSGSQGLLMLGIGTLTPIMCSGLRSTAFFFYAFGCLQFLQLTNMLKVDAAHVKHLEIFFPVIDHTAIDKFFTLSWSNQFSPLAGHRDKVVRANSFGFVPNLPTVTPCVCSQRGPTTVADWLGLGQQRVQLGTLPALSWTLWCVFVLVFASQIDEAKQKCPTISQKPGCFFSSILTNYTIMERTEVGLERGLSTMEIFDPAMSVQAVMQSALASGVQEDCIFVFISVCAETYNPDEEEDDAESRIIHPKTDDQRNRLQEACKDILLFKNLDPEQMSQVLDAMFEKQVEGGEHVIDQGDDGDNFYVIDRGTYDIYVKCDGVGRCVGTYDNRGSFGELALMYNTPRAATIIATSPGAIWGLDRVTFRRIIVKNNAKKRRMYENFIESLPFLKSLEVSERLKVVDVIGTKVYKDGEQIIAQGDLADSFFIVESGEVRIIMTRKGKQDVEENGAVEIARCSRGQYFGELALVTNKPRAASAFALGTVKCLVMDVQAFERLLGPCKEILKRNIANYEEQLVALFGSNMDIADTSA
ncbi:PREDICTED: cAMP-dependent protein kinase type II-beta regulatory subunit-like [Mesitornis unicolor]|uniref:cAMP-dependent protein kinase type II-beta regulatory subunit-like n=1 Tax=Mesitornis unicolor TaxID=54374 RepID=UPI0005292C20|nr:PREDICTED: cAMP-dependent protein kinase type II-beta regulatory subunit-like [Mesitornis unicolor]